MTDKLSELADKWLEQGEISEGVWQTLGNKAETLEQRIEELEGDGHSMDCDTRKDAVSTPKCSCGWAERMANLTLLNIDKVKDDDAQQEEEA